MFAVSDKYEERLSLHRLHLMLVQPGHVGNVGTVLRSMLASGVRDLAALVPAADPFSPHATRASVGARFAVRVESFPGLRTYRRRFDHPLVVLEAGADTPLDELRLPQRHTFALSPEWSGLPRELRDTGVTARIPQGDLVESLNPAVAASIALYVSPRGQHGP